MKLPFSLALVCTFLVALASDAPQPPRGLRHERITYNGAEYDVVWVDLRERELELFWKRPDQEAHKNIRGLKEWLSAQGKRLEFATNAGIFGTDGAPLGLHVEEGEELRALNLGKGGRGNFYLKPNGVFLVDASGARVITAPEYKDAGLSPALAVQSGPMLVIDGELHPKFLKDATSTHIRNGVGVRGTHEVVFVISRTPVIFHDFASVFRDVLKCTDALYLDGTLSALYAPWAGRHDSGIRFVAMLGVVGE